ncbi:MAG: hypothetical protein A2Y34_11845 [Spirochaetes bacterium GWC1_27_15]|nr:MAG: hypothetical protein A2Z98_13425 [Spirochaetes bacterium GWB1_27_13]OHD20920.1 MAG: hypothetical protein A2Y34_11845 [Spirochaetes bacterium GWC1_27_15]
MQYKRYFFILYLVIFFISIFFVVLYFVLFLNIKLSVFDLFFVEKNVPVVSVINSIEGNEVYYNVHKNNREILRYNTQIQKDMVIETGVDSSVSFFIKDHGLYYLYPNATLHIKKIENFTSYKSTKESFFVLEKGSLYSNVNFYSRNSYLIVETDELFSKFSNAKVIIDKEDFETKILCFDGNVNFRPYSSKFDFFQDKRSYVITSSIERLINSSNILKKKQISVINNIYQKKMDNLITRIYESKNTKFVNKDYIKNSLTIPLFDLEDKNYNFPELDINKFSFLNNGHLEIFTKEGSSKISFNNQILKDNTRYLFYIKKDDYEIEEELPFTKIISKIKVIEGSFKNIQLKRHSGIINVSLNNKKLHSYKKEKDILNIKNSLSYCINCKSESIKNLFIKSDLNIEKMYFLFEKEINYQNFFKTGSNIEFNNKKYYIYDYGFDDKKNISIYFYEANYENLLLVAKFEDVYYEDLN